jgi:hypothetical protein
VTRRRVVLAGIATLAALQLSLSLWAASTIQTVDTVDTADYFVVARNLAEGRGLTASVVWEFLAAPDAVRHPAGDYWDVGWPLVLGLILRVVGTSQRAAIGASAALSSLLPVATSGVAWASARRAGKEPFARAMLAGLLVCLQSRLVMSNVSPDVTLFYQLTSLAGLGAALSLDPREASIAKRIAVGAALAIPMHVRGEGFVVLLCALPCVMAGAGVSWRERARALSATLAGVALVGSPFWARNLAAFGHLAPPSHALRLWMVRYDELFRFLSTPSPARLSDQGFAALARVRLDAIRGHVDLLTRQAPWPLVVLAIVGAALALRTPGDRPAASAVPLFVLLSLLVPCLVAPVIANDGRFVMNTLPALSVLASSAIVALAGGLRAKQPALGPLAALALGAASVLVFRGNASVRTGIGYLDAFRRTPACLAHAGTVASLRMTPSDVVMADDAWRVAAVMDVAAVRPPRDGEAAEDEVLARYAPRFVLADTAQLQRLAQRHGMVPVAAMQGGTWYAARR